MMLMTVAATVVAGDEPAETPTVGSLPASRVLFLGNSITLHGPAPQIGWTGNWGMAASSQQKDYVHLLTADISRLSGTAPQTMVKNIAAFERGYETYDIAKELKPELDFEADIVIVAIGENASEPKSDEAKAAFADAFSRLLAELKQHGSPTIFVRSSFWPNATKDGIMRKVSADAQVTFIDLAAVGLDASHAASAERKFEHAGVAAHPGDKGMQTIADAILVAVKQRAGIESAP